MPEVGTLAQVSVYVAGSVTINVPPQSAVFPLQFPELTATDTVLYVPSAGLFQVGAPVQLRPLLTDADVPLLLLQVTAGAVIALPTAPEIGKLAQVSVYVILELLLDATDELLGFELDDDEIAELEMTEELELL